MRNPTEFLFFLSLSLPLFSRSLSKEERSNERRLIL